MVSINEQINYIVQWLSSYSDYQKEDFSQILARKIEPLSTSGGHGVHLNGLVNGLASLETNGTTSRPPSLFTCQMKLFSDWWESMSEVDRGTLTNRIQQIDSKFWAMVDDELKGTTKKDIDIDFFVLPVGESIINGNSNSVQVQVQEKVVNNVTVIGHKNEDVTVDQEDIVEIVTSEDCQIIGVNEPMVELTMDGQEGEV